MAGLHGELNVLGVVIAAADDDEVLAASRDEQLAGAKEPQVPGAEKRAAPGLRKIRRECLFGLFGPSPVTLRNARSGDPDLADLVSPGWPPGLRIDNDDLLATSRLTATDQRCGAWIFRRDLDDPAFAECDAIYVSKHRYRGVRSAGDQQCRLRQPIHRIKRLRPKTRRGEGLGETLQGRATHRLRTAHGRRPVGQIERRTLFRGTEFDAHVVSEVGCGSDQGVMPRHRFQPPHWALDERARRHEGASTPDINRLEDTADETHVVVGRQPEHSFCVSVESRLPRLADGLQVVD